MVRDLDLEHLQGPWREALRSCGGWSPFVWGAQLASDTTLVSALRSDGSARGRAADFDGVALEAVRRRKARTLSELVGHIAEPTWLSWREQVVR